MLPRLIDVLALATIPLSSVRKMDEENQEFLYSLTALLYHKALIKSYAEIQETANLESRNLESRFQETFINNTFRNIWKCILFALILLYTL